MTLFHFCFVGKISRIVVFWPIKNFCLANQWLRVWSHCDPALVSMDGNSPGRLKKYSRVCSINTITKGPRLSQGVRSKNNQ